MRIQATDSTMEAVFRERYKSSSPPPWIYISSSHTTNARAVFAGHDGFHTRLYIRVYNAAAVAEGCVHSAVNAPAHVKRGRVSAGLIFEKRPRKRPTNGVSGFYIRLLCIRAFFSPAIYSCEYLMYIIYYIYILGMYAPLQQSSPIYIYIYEVGPWYFPTYSQAKDQRADDPPCLYVHIMCYQFCGPDDRKLPKSSRI